MGARRRTWGAVALTAVLAVAPAGAALGAGAPARGAGRAAPSASAASPGVDPAEGQGDDGEGDDGGLWNPPPSTAPRTAAPSTPSASTAAPSGTRPAVTPVAAAGPLPGSGDGHDLVLHAFLVLDCVVISGAAFSYGRRARRAAARGRSRLAPLPGGRR